MTKHDNAVYMHVTDIRWDTYGKPSFRNKVIFELCKRLKGPAKDVEPGWYVVKLVRTGLNLAVKLAPYTGN